MNDYYTFIHLLKTMATNDLKPNYSSSEEEEDEDEEPEEASASEDEQQTSGSDSEQVSDSDSEQKPKPKPEPKKILIAPSKPVIKHHVQSKSSSEPEESASETDSDSPPKKPSFVTNPNPNIKPISSVPMQREGTIPGKKSGSKTTSTPAVSPASKRPAVAPASEKETKKAKSVTVTDDDSKKQLFQRLWSEDDEIVILQGMIDYMNDSGENLIADMGAFHEFIKKSLHVDVSRAQLVDKIRRLKKKFVNNVSREKNGKDRSFSKSHEQKGYELSKLIWGNGSSYTSVTDGKKKQGQKNAALVQSNGSDEKEVEMMEGEKNMDISRFVRHGGRDEGPVLPEEIVKGGMELVEGSKRLELEERWKSLKKQELELYLKKMEFVKEQALVVLEAVNSSGN
ncbi:hypothetical protein QVD17_35219 [Tagetes erecta]|uniref:Uncharacterized protein n=1 Tax=Tagetes erecta TaxID=13708 RepID=A0AAD8NM66_TARER|nr:hypothetical protein QVD17_35219 [Tagetes erecta]